MVTFGSCDKLVAPVDEIFLESALTVDRGSGRFGKGLSIHKLSPSINVRQTCEQKIPQKIGLGESPAQYPPTHSVSLIANKAANVS